jgi:tRNA pseudouridine38-40 synthase
MNIYVALKCEIYCSFVDYLEMYRYFIRLAYDGTNFCGWQKQSNAPTVQEFLEKAIKCILGEIEGVTGCGRTDTGVHATEFYAHFDAAKAYSADELAFYTYRLNGYLPDEIVIFEILPVAPNVHARFTAIWREYEYVLVNRKDPFSNKIAYRIFTNPDIEKLNLLSGLLLGEQDFECFSKTHTQVNNFICNVLSASWKKKEHFLYFRICADRFLRNMVRAIVGTLLESEKKGLNSEEFQMILDSKNRCNAGMSVPAKGLSLKRVAYPEEIFTKTPCFFTKVP